VPLFYFRPSSPISRLPTFCNYVRASDIQGIAGAIFGSEHACVRNR